MKILKTIIRKHVNATLYPVYYKHKNLLIILLNNYLDSWLREKTAQKFYDTHNNAVEHSILHLIIAKIRVEVESLNAKSICKVFMVTFFLFLRKY